MSMGYDAGDTPVEPSTSRGRDWPCLRQFNVFLENRVGALNDLLRAVEREDLRIAALTILDSVDCAVARLVMSNYERAVELLDFANLVVFETEVIGVLLPTTEQPHVTVCSDLMKAEVGIHYTYPLCYQREGRSAIAVYVEDVDEALRVLKAEGHEFVTEDDLESYDPQAPF